MTKSLADAPFEVSEAPTEPELIGKCFRVLADLARSLLADNAEHVAACRRA